MNLLQQGFALLQSQQAAACGEQVTYQRGNVSKVLTAVLSSFLFRLDDAMGARVEHSDMDFIVARSDLEGAGLWPPERDDLVTRTFNGSPQVYRVHPFDRNERPYRAVEDGGRVRVHTKLDSGSA